jgi:toxin CptA
LLMTAIILMAMPMLWWLKVISLMVLAIYSCHLVWRHALLRSAASIVRLRCHAEGLWTLTTAQGAVEERLRGDSVATQWLCMLRFQRLGRYYPRTCLVFRDSLSREEYRQLLAVLYQSLSTG